MKKLLFLTIVLLLATNIHLVAQSPEQPISVLKSFLSYLGEQDYKKAYELVAPSSKLKGDAIVTDASLNYKSFVKELTESRRLVFDDGVVVRPPPPTSKFIDYKLGKHRWDTANRLRIWFHGTGDNDELVLIKESGNWFIADPIHLIR